MILTFYRMTPFPPDGNSLILTWDDETYETNIVLAVGDYSREPYSCSPLSFNAWRQHYEGVIWTQDPSKALREADCFIDEGL